jgi:hypothetical protein
MLKVRFFISYKNKHFILSSRLYESLPDIRQKAVQIQRQETYTANRVKAQEFQKVCIWYIKLLHMQQRDFLRFSFSRFSNM